MSSSIAERLLLIRGKSKQGEFAAKIGVNPNTLRGYESGRVEPSFEFLVKICTEFSVNPTWLLMGKGAERGEATTMPTPQASGTACSGCVELYAELVLAQKKIIHLQEQTQAQKEALLEENGVLKAEIAVLQQRLSPPAATSGESPHAKTA